MLTGTRRMAMTALLVVAAAILADSASAPPKKYKSVSDASNKKINMVISTLKDILQSVVNEEKQETEMYNKYMGWCDTESASLKKDLTETKTALANTKVLNEEQTSSIDTLTLFVQKSEKEMEETKDAIAQAVALRTDENEKYTEEMQLNTQSLRQISNAIKHVSGVQKAGGFLQNGVLKKLALNQPGESSYVLGVMKGLDEKLKKTRVELETVEKEKVKMHNEFMDTKGKSMKALGEASTAKKITLSETTAQQAGTKRKIAKLTDEVASLQSSVQKTSETCTSTKQDWKVRQGDRDKEKAALSEAIRYLTESSFEQLSLVQQRAEDTEDHEQNDDASVVFSPSLLQTGSVSKFANNAFYAAANAELLGEDDENVADAQIEGHMKKDSFTGVKSVVQKLISSHQDTQQEEKTKKEYCTKEIESKEDEQATTKDDLEAVTAEIGKKSAEVEQLTTEVKNLYASIEGIKTALEKAAKIRKEEAALYASSSKDRKLALKVLSQAKTVLQNFYDQNKGSFAQGARAGQPAAVPKSGRKSAASFGAVSMVQDIADDIAKEQKDADIAETEAAGTFATLQKDSQTKTDEKQQDVTDRVTAKAKLGVNINTLKETEQQKKDDLTGITKQLGALHEECDELLANFDKRKKARTFEVSQLRDVMDILSGSSIASRTGLMQEDESAEGEDDTAADN